MKPIIYALLFFVICGWIFPVSISAHEESDNDPHAVTAERNPSPPEEIPPVSDLVLEEPLRRDASVYGIDVSRYQGTIDWSKVRNYGPHSIDFMYAKASQGVTLRDPTYVRNMTEARHEGILVGSYHYFSSGGPGKDQCDYFMETMQGIHQDLIPVVDVEECSRSWGALTLRRNLKDFLVRMEENYGIRPIIYTGIFFYNLYLSEEFKDYKLFIARYSDDEPLTNDGTDWTIWQFSESGRIDGIRHKVDLNCINGKYSIDDILLISQESGPNPHHRTKPHHNPNPLPYDAGLEH